MYDGKNGIIDPLELNKINIFIYWIFKIHVGQYELMYDNNMINIEINQIWFSLLMVIFCYLLYSLRIRFEDIN